jgi:hypothetical protein
VPAFLLGLAVLLYVFSSTTFWKIAALLVVAGPGLYMGVNQIRNASIDYRIRQNALGRGYFSGSTLKSLGAAVVERDLAALQRLGPSVDLNTVGERGMTLMGLAAEQIREAATPERAASGLLVVQALLKLGAKPDAALDTAMTMADPELLATLLAAGADPNQLEDGQPVIFARLSTLPVANLRLLIEHGLNVDIMSRQSPLAFDTAQKRRWDLVALLAEHHANLLVPRSDGRTVAQEVAAGMAEAATTGVPAPELLQVQSALQVREPVQVD